MAWIELHQALRKHPKTLHFASLLGVEDPDLARAKLENLWLWALDYCPSGRLTVRSRHLSAAEIANAADWHGDAAVFLRSLQESGFVEESPGGNGGKSLYLHDWEQYGGKLHAARAADAGRKRDARKSGRPADVHSDGGGRGEERRGEEIEKRRGEERRPPDAPPSPPSSASPGGFPDSDPEPPAVRRRDIYVGTQAVDSNGNGKAGATTSDVVLAVKRHDPTFPSWKIESECRRALRAGATLDELYRDVDKLGDRMKIWTIVDNYEHPSRKAGNGAPPSRPAPERHPVLDEPRDVVQKRQDEARAKVDAILANLDPEELKSWRAHAEAKAVEAKIKEGPTRDLFITTALRQRAAEDFGVEGL